MKTNDERVTILVNGEFHSTVPTHHVDSIVDDLELCGFNIEDETWISKGDKNNTWGRQVCSLTVNGDDMTL